ncbi:MAG: rRNA maturation RNase YbeY [Saprospiraceae bacterium]|nr:rRNA maturation RNase YbeY [Saprospiraceae bacterium]
MPITFHKEAIEFELPDEDRLKDWLVDIVTEEEKMISQLSYIFCSDEYLLEINKTYLNHDYYTDIITFPYKQGKTIESDIFISIDRVKDNAEKYNTSFQKELLRVIAHGVLHLVGYKDKTEEEQKEMRSKEDWAIERF